MKIDELINLCDAHINDDEPPDSRSVRYFAREVKSFLLKLNEKDFDDVSGVKI